MPAEGNPCASRAHSSTALASHRGPSVDWRSFRYSTWRPVSQCRAVAATWRRGEVRCWRMPRRRALGPRVADCWLCETLGMTLGLRRLVERTSIHGVVSASGGTMGTLRGVAGTAGGGAGAVGGVVGTLRTGAVTGVAGGSVGTLRTGAGAGGVGTGGVVVAGAGAVGSGVRISHRC
jgi:hypothetical protein